MKLREVLKRIKLLSKMEEGEKVYFSDKSGYILKEGKILTFDENKNKVYRPRFTKEEYIDVQYNNAIDILMGIEIIHGLLEFIPSISNIDLYDSDIVSNSKYYPDNSLMSNDTSIKSLRDDHLILITYMQSDIHRFVMKAFDVDLKDYSMTLHILEGNKLSDTIDYYTRSGYLSEHAIEVLNREKNGENAQSIINTSYDMYFDDCESFDDMIKKTKKQSTIKSTKIG